MPKKNKQTTTSSQNTQFQYDPTGTAYLTNLINKPFQDSAFLLEKGMINDQALQLGQRYISNLINNMIVSGFSGGQGMPGFMASQLARAGRSTGHTQSQGLLQAMLQATQRQFAAGSVLGQRRIGETTQGKSTSTQSSSGGILGPLLTAGLVATSPYFPGANNSSSGAVPITMGGGPFGQGGAPNFGMAGVNSGPYNTSFWDSYVPGFNTSNSTMQRNPYFNPQPLYIPQG